MVFQDYLDLKIAVSEHVNNRNISDVMKRLVQQAESNLNRQLRTRKQITSDTLTFTNGAATLPTDFLEMINVYDGNGQPMRAGTLSGNKAYGANYWRYSINGSQVLIEGISGDRDIEYYAALPTITSSVSGSNWLLQQYPDVYLYASGLEAAKFLRDAELVTATQALLAQSMTTLMADDEKARWSNATVRVVGATP